MRVASWEDAQQMLFAFPTKPDKRKRFVSTGHFALKWGTIGFLVGYVAVFATGIIGDSGFALLLGTLASLVTMAGLVCWIVGMVQRVRFNRAASEPLPFTIGEKIAIVGGALLLVGILVANGVDTGEGSLGALLLGIPGIVAAGGGAIWHLLTPRRGEERTRQ